MPECESVRRGRQILRDERIAAAAANAAAAEAEAAAAAEVWLDRTRVAARLGNTPRRLKTWLAAGRGPVPVKIGDTPQSPVRWHADEVAAWIADPAGYEQAKRITPPHGPGADAGHPSAGPRRSPPPPPPGG